MPGDGARDEEGDVSLPDATESTAITAATTEPASTAASASSKKQKRKRTPKMTTISQFTIRNPPWIYLHLTLTSPSSNAPQLDAVTAHLNLTAALSQFLGLHGTAIPIDILKVEDQDVWIRVPAQDKSALIAAAGGWVGRGGEGWRLKGWSAWNAVAPGRDAGQELFND